MTDPIRVLYVDDYPPDRLLVRDALEKEHDGFVVTEAASRAEFEAALAGGGFDLVLSDFNILGFEGLQVLEAVRAVAPDTPVVIVTGTGSEEVAVEAMKRGAADYVIKTPKHIQRLPVTIHAALANKALEAERRSAERQIARQLQRLSALRAIDTAISTSLDLHAILATLIAHAVEDLQVDAAAILLFDAHARTLTHVAARGFRTHGLQPAALDVAASCAGRAVLEQRLIKLPRLRDAAGDPRAKWLRAEDFACCFAVPLLAKGQPVGVLEILHRAQLDPDQEWLDFLHTLAQQAAIAINDALVFERLQRSNTELAQAYDATIEGWSRALDLRDKETEGHTQRVTALTLILAREAGLNEEELVYVRWGALLHDIGKLGVPDSILLKAGALTAEEWESMRQHPALAYEMLLPIRYLKSALDIPYCHHERWDGTGYPRGLKGEQIPLAARIFAVVDVWDALRSDRPYRRGWPPDRVFAHIRAEAGAHFDPRIAALFLRMVSADPPRSTP